MRDRFVIGLVGEGGSGKDTVADYLKHRYDATLLRFSDPIKEILSMFFDRPSREDQSWLAVVLKERFGKDVFSKAMERKIHNGGLISINGLRYMEDYEFLRSFDNSRLIYI